MKLDHPCELAKVWWHLALTPVGKSLSRLEATDSSYRSYCYALASGHSTHVELRFRSATSQVG
jgi:hypothetical protein